jgi:hypothetical protein
LLLGGSCFKMLLVLKLVLQLIRRNSVSDLMG